MTWRRKWQPTPVFLPGKSHGQRSLAGSIGSQRVRHDWSDLARMHKSVMKVSQMLLQHKLLLHRTQEAGKEQGAQRPEVSGHKLKKAWLQTQAHQCKSCSTTGQKRGSANQMVKTTAQFVVIMKTGDRWFTDHNETIHKSALLRLEESTRPMALASAGLPLSGSEPTQGGCSPWDQQVNTADSLGKPTQQELPDLNLPRNERLSQGSTISNLEEKHSLQAVGQSPGWPWVLPTNQSMHSPLGDADTQPHDKEKTKTPARKPQTPKHDTTMGFFKEHYSFLRVSHTQYHVILLSTDKNSWPQKAPSALQNGRPQARIWGSQISHTLKKQ